MHRTFYGKMSCVKSNKLLPDMKQCDTTLEQEFEIKILHKSPFEKEQFDIRIYSNNQLFVFVFGDIFRPNNIRIRIR